MRKVALGMAALAFIACQKEENLQEPAQGGG